MTDELKEGIALSTLVDKFGIKQKQRFFDKQSEGLVGWNTLSPEDVETIKAKMQNAINGERWIDVANFSAMLWNHDWKNFLGRDFIMQGEDPEHFEAKFGI